nr:cycloartenol synthase [Ipomoea batatas]
MPSLPDKEEWKKQLMGSFYGSLSWHNNVVVKPVVQSKALSNTPESVISHSSGEDRASLKYDEAVAEKVNNSKKRKRGSSRMPNNGPEPPPGLPVEFRNFILQLAGNRAIRVEKLVIQKKLTNTDVNSTWNRLSIPARLVREEFVTEEEHLLLCQHNGKNVCSIEVPLITPMMEVAKGDSIQEDSGFLLLSSLNLLLFLKGQETPSINRSICKACKFLLSKQLPSGGWRRVTYLVVYTNIEGNRSHVVHMAWAMLSLIVAGEVLMVSFV